MLLFSPYRGVCADRAVCFMYYNRVIELRNEGSGIIDSECTFYICTIYYF